MQSNPSRDLKPLEPQEYFKMAYTRVFGTMELQSKLSNVNPLSTYIYNYISNHAQIKNSFLHNIEGCLTKLKHNFYIKQIRMYNFGSTVIIHKLNNHDLPKIYVVFNSSWQLDCSIKQSQTKMFPTPLPNFNILYAGELPHFIGFEQDTHKFVQSYNRINNFPLGNSHNKNPTWLAQACQLAISNMRAGMDQNLQPPIKGGTLHMDGNGGRTKPDTIWSATWAYFYYLAQDNQLIRALMVAYKAYMLKRYCLQELQRSTSSYKLNYLQQKSTLACFMNCLQDLRSQLEYLCGQNNYYYCNQKAIQVMQQISQVIIKINIPYNPVQYSLKYMGTVSAIPQVTINLSSLVPRQSQQRQQQQQRMQNLSHSFLISPNNIVLDLITKYESSHLWILAVQDTFFTMAFNQLLNYTPFRHLQMNIIAKKMNNPNERDSDLMKLLKCYINTMKPSGTSFGKSSNVFGMGLQCQVESHIQLMKAIFCVIGFEIFKRQKKETQFNINEYKIPINIPNLYSAFNSLSYKARRAMERLHQYYQKNEKLIPFFDLDLKYAHFKRYAENVGSENISMKTSLKAKMNALQNDKKVLIKKINDYHVQHKKLLGELQQLQKKTCSCYYIKIEQQQYSYRLNKNIKVQKQKKIQCNLCKQIKKQKQKIIHHQNLTQYQLKTYIPVNDGLIHQFFYHLDAQLQGLLNLVFIAQSSKIQSYTSVNTNNCHQVFYKNNLLINTDQPRINQFRLLEAKQKNIERYVKHSKDSLNLFWQGVQDNTVSYIKMNEDQFNVNMKPYEKFADFIRSPTAPPSHYRQHQVYAKLIQKPQNISLQQYIAVGSCRIGEYTQIPMILEALKNRTITVDTLSNNYQFIMKLLYRCLSPLYITKPIYETQQVSKNIWEGAQYFFQSFLNFYQTEWNSKDFHSLPVIGPLISLMSRTIKDRRKKVQKFEYLFVNSQINTQKLKAFKIIQNIMKKLFQQYNRLQQDNKNSSQNEARQIVSNRANQCFICFSGLCCFSEQTINQNDRLAVDFVKLIVIMKYKQVYLQGDGQNYYKIIKKFQIFKIRAIANNMRSVNKYFLNSNSKGKPNISKLTKIVKIIDENIDQQTEWHKDNSSQFLYRGEDRNNNIYKIDIKDGKITKNGQTISRVPQIFKNSEQYKRIFDIRDFQVYPSATKHSMITKRNFIDLFKGNLDSNDKVYFEFVYLANNRPAFNMIFWYYDTEEEETWRLLSQEDLIKMMHLPKYYAQNFYGWYNKQKSCIVFRSPQLGKIGQVVLVSFIQSEEIPRRKIINSHIISKQHYRSPLNQLCDANSRNFDKLILRQNKQNLSYKVLSNIQKVEYIIETQSYQQNQRKFWLHRLDLLFIQDSQNGIIPQNFKNYRISTNPFTHKLIPWSEQDQISCLVLQKFVFNEATQQLHNTKIIIPAQQINQHGVVNIPQFTNQSRQIFIYDIHDHFYDIRGMNRVSQLHLVALLASVNKNISHPTLRITPIQYAIRTMNSCFNNTPLTFDELQKIKNIIAISICQQNQTLILLCHALLRCTDQVQNFKKQNYQQVSGHKKWFVNQTYRDIINKTMSKYNWKLRDSRVPYRQRISQQFANIIGLRCFKGEQLNKGKQKIWRQQNKLSFTIPQIIINQLKNKYNLILEEWKAINKQMIKLPNQINNPQNINQHMKQFPLKIQNPQQKQLIKQVYEQLKKSYEQYHQYDENNRKIRINKAEAKQKFEKICIIMTKAKQEINKIINGIILQNCNHIDVITGYRPALSPFDFVKMLLEAQQQNKQNIFQQIYPQFTKKQGNLQHKENLIDLIKLYLLFSVKLDSCQRILNILKQFGFEGSDAETDRVALLRQCQSPREQIQKRVYWVCFEAQMKLQIWKSQYQTYETLLLKNQTGSVTQLNMGQGKTQIIIPMITLQLIYGSSLQKYAIFNDQQQVKKIPRINLLESLIKQSYFNYFRFLSITSFNIPIIILPFDRKVNLQKVQILNQIIRSLGYFKQKMLILLDQSSTHSLILKLRQEALKKSEGKIFNKEYIIFSNISTFDIFDEVDAQLTPKKSFVYSIGKQSELNELQYRISIVTSLIESLCISLDQLYQHKLIVFDQTYQLAQQSLELGQFPKGLRLMANVLSNQNRKIDFRKHILIVLVRQIKIVELKFLQTLNKRQLDRVIQYLINDLQNESLLSNNITESAKKVLYALRGFLAYGILEHTFSMRCKVQYGIPDEERKKKKRLAVPYQAADIPSKKNDYAHPDVAIMLSFFAYYNYGLTYDEVIEGFQRFFKLTSENETARNAIYKQWYNSLSEEQRRELKVVNSLQIKLHSVSQRQKLFNAFKMNRKFIAYWLHNCVFYKDMAQFVNSITSSSWDHSKVESCIGFSGTKDNCRLLPTYVKLIRSENLEIAGTDGKMLDMLMENVLEVKDVQSGNEPLWERFLNTVFDLPSQYNVASIIDAGAILASKPMKEHIVPWISRNNRFNANRKFKGISFCSDNSWKVFKLSTHDEIDRGTSIPDNETFVIFDEYRTRGADMKMDANISAVLTLSPTITKDTLMQAVGRLRKLGRNQKVIVLVTDEVKSKISKDYTFRNSMSTKQKVKAILSWSCLNSVKENEKFLFPNAKLAEIHFKNIQNQMKPQINKTQTQLIKMYANNITYLPISQVCIHIISQALTLDLPETQRSQLQTLKIISIKYGSKTKIKFQNFEQVCERESQFVQQKQQQKQQQTYVLIAKQQQQQIILQQLSKHHKFKFSDKIQISHNFSYCTQKSSIFSNDLININQLMNSYFVIMSSNSISMVTQRQVYRLLTKTKLPFYQTDIQQEQNKFVARLSDLSINDRFIKQNKLQQAYVHCKFFNGSCMFEEDTQIPILQKLLGSQQDKLNKIKYFIDKRKKSNKYKSSSLQKVCMDLQLIAESLNSQIIKVEILDIEDDGFLSKPAQESFYDSQQQEQSNQNNENQ